jgi:hypothetical protein
MAISPNGEQFLLGGGKLTLWNTKDAQPATDLFAKYKPDQLERPLMAMAISADGKWIAASDQKGKVRVWSLSDQREVLILPSQNEQVTQLALSPNASLLASTSYAGEVDLWQLPDGKPLKRLKVSKEQINRLAFVSDNLLAAANSEIVLWDVASNKKEADLTSKKVTSPAFALSQDRRVLAFNDSDENVQFWDVASSKPAGVPLRRAGAGLIAFSHDLKWLATYSGHSEIRIWDAATGGCVQVIDADGDRTTALEWFPNANVLLVSSLDGRARMWGTADDARSLGIEPMALPALSTKAAGEHKPLSSAQFQRVMDVRSLPRLPGAVPQWDSFNMCGYTASAAQEEAALFYRYVLGKSGWTEEPAPTTPGALAFRKDDCMFNISLTPADAGAGARTGGSEVGKQNLQVSLQFGGNYDARWLPKLSTIASKSDYDSFAVIMLRTKESLVETEVALLRQYHEAGWTPYTRLGSSAFEDPNVRHISLLQGGSELTVMISHPADSKDELVVQSSAHASNKSLPIPPDAGLIEFDNSTDLQTVINTNMDLAQTTKFYDELLAAEGWLARDDGRQMKDDKGWLPYIRGQQDILVRLAARPGGGTRIVVGEAAKFSWQLKEPVKATRPSDKPGMQAADLTLPAGATGVKYDVDEKQIEFELADTNAPKLAEQMTATMDALGWKRTKSGINSDEYVLASFANGKAEISLRARPSGKATTASIGGDGLLWDKALPVAPVPISYETWLRRNRKDASLELLDRFAAEMHKIQAADAHK